ncbi:MAG: hypothetical protein J0M04_07825 [Verrucomicrobia bacterium]|nr:hypothetical protein [Verrucomicrobiota bacterium]
MRMLPLIALFSISQAHAEITVSPGTITDTRTDGKFFASLEVKLILSGPELANAKGMRVRLATATDNTGKNLIDKEKLGFLGDSFRPLEEPFGPEPAKKGDFETEVKLANPPRAATSINLTGSIELLSPDADPSSVITLDVAEVAGKAIDNPALKATGAEITINKPKGEEFSYKIKDTGNKVAVVEFCTAEGKPLKTNGTSSMGFGSTKSCSVSIPNAPDKVTVKIHLLTEKSLVKVPLKITGLKLP